jgi:hypothetical protein
VASEIDPVRIVDNAVENGVGSSVEIAHMEQAICWPARYLRLLPHLVRPVQAVAVSRSRDCDLENAARRLRLPGHLVRRWNAEGLALIARGLLVDRVRIF